MNKIHLEENVKRVKKILQLNRIKILNLLDKRETCACELVSKLNLPNNLVSHHLKVLSNLGLLDKRKIGLHIKYSIKPLKKKQISRLLNCLLSYTNESNKK